MMKKPNIRFTGFYTLLFMCSIYMCAHTAVLCETGFSRKKMNIAPVDIYTSVLEYIKEEEYDKVKVSVAYLNPLITSLKKNYNADIMSEIGESLNNKDKAKLINAVYKLIFFDMRDIFKELSENSKEYEKRELTAWLKMAYRNYIFLSPTVKKFKKDGFNIDRSIRKDFKRSYRILSAASPYREEEKRIHIEHFTVCTQEITKNIVKVFPQFKTEKQNREDEKSNGRQGQKPGGDVKQTEKTGKDAGKNDENNT